MQDCKSAKCWELSEPCTLFAKISWGVVKTMGRAKSSHVRSGKARRMFGCERNVIGVSENKVSKRNNWNAKKNSIISTHSLVSQRKSGGIIQFPSSLVLLIGAGRF